MSPLRLRVARASGLIAAGIVFACVGDNPANVGPADDAGRDEQQPPPDAAPDQPTSRPCDRAAGFGAAEALGPEINSAADEADFKLSPDELTAWLSSTRISDGGALFQLYVTQRSVKDASFDVPVFAPSISPNGFNVFSGAPTADTLSMYTTLSSGLPNVQIARSTRTEAGAPFDAPTDLDGGDGGVNTLVDEVSPYISPDGSTLYFAFNGNGKFWIMTSTNVDGGFSTPSPVDAADVNLVASDSFYPVISADGRTLYFSSNRGGSFDVYRATRTAVPGTFGPATAVAELNSANNDIATWISPDECAIYFLRGDTIGGPRNVFVAKRPP